MVDLIRQEIATTASPIVIKVGTRVLTQPNGQLDEERIGHLADQFHRLIEAGRQIVLISSGAVGAGMSALGMTERPRDLAQLQAVAAVGQAKLTESYDRRLRSRGYHAAQVLLTAADLQDRTSYLNVRNTLSALLSMGALPIINENDTVAVDELMRTFGDNDCLAALVTNLLAAPLLIILSDIDGLYDGPPDAPTSQIIRTVSRIDETVASYAQDHVPGLSKGGMASKLSAARMCTLAGENVILADGRATNIVERIANGEPIGTAFLAQGKVVTPWKRWIGFSAKPAGVLKIDTGACEAVVKHGRSLLAIGIERADGEFSKGDVVALHDHRDQERARGLTNYESRELREIVGLRSDQIAQTLGHCTHQEVIHRDNLAVIDPHP